MLVINDNLTNNITYYIIMTRGDMIGRTKA
jgi:hypothetical protein